MPRGLIVILIVSKIFLSPYLDFIMVSLSTVSFLAQCDSATLCLQNVFYRPMNWMVLSLKLIGLSLPFFKSDYLYAFDLYHVVFLLTLYLGVAVQPCLEWIPINKKKKKKKIL